MKRSSELISDDLFYCPSPWRARWISAALAAQRLRVKRFSPANQPIPPLKVMAQRARASSIG
nr:MAG TPA: hypothetical protein [Caudoviricetes sp.]